MPMPMSLSHPWLFPDPTTGLSEAPPHPGAIGHPGLVPAVAGIVTIAAERARLTGDLPALREAVERALDSVLPAPTDPREAGLPDLPRITDADRAEEVTRLRRLMARQRR